MCNPFHKTLQDRVNEDIWQLRKELEKMEATQKEMTIREIRKYKEKAEEEIREILIHFMYQTNMVVERAELGTLDVHFKGDQIEHAGLGGVELVVRV